MVEIGGPEGSGRGGPRDTPERIARVEPLEHGPPRPRLLPLRRDVEVDVDQSIADADEHERGHHQRRRLRGERHGRDRQTGQRDRHAGTEREPLQARRAREHRRDRGERQE
jgi:hypothetical protein